MTLYNLGTNTVVASPTDQQIQAGVDFRNAAATQRPDIYGANTYTLAQAKADIAGQFVAFYAPSGTIRGYVILNVCSYGDPDQPANAPRSVAVRIGDLVIDPSLFNATTIRTVMNLIKTWTSTHQVNINRVVGEVEDDSPFWTQYAQPRGYRVICTVPNPTVANPSRNLLLIDRVFGVDG